MPKKKKFESPVAPNIRFPYNEEGFNRLNVAQFSIRNLDDNVLEHRIFYHGTYSWFEFQDRDNSTIYESAYMSSKDLRLIAKELNNIADEMDVMYQEND